MQAVLDPAAVAEMEEAKRQARLEQEAELAKEDAILSKLTSEEIRQVVELVTKETFKSINVRIYKYTHL